MRLAITVVCVATVAGLIALVIIGAWQYRHDAELFHQHHQEATP